MISRAPDRRCQSLRWAGRPSRTTCCATRSRSWTGAWKLMRTGSILGFMIGRSRFGSVIASSYPGRKWSPSQSMSTLERQQGFDGLPVPFAQLCGATLPQLLLGQPGVINHQGAHRLGHWNDAGRDAGVMAAMGGDIRWAAFAIDGPLGLGN